MAFFLVTMTHPDGKGWGQHVGPHVAYLKGLIEAGKIRASGPVTGLGKRAGFIIMTVESREEVQTLVDADPLRPRRPDRRADHPRMGPAVRGLLGGVEPGVRAAS